MALQSLELSQPEAPLALLKRVRAMQRQLCDNLESIADQLRGDTDLSLCRSAWDCLRLDLPLFHRDEEVFLELLCEDHPLASSLVPGVRLATDEHAVNEAYAIDLSEWLENLCSGERPENLEAAAYALRGCFDGIRRHLNWEDAMLVPSVPAAIASADTSRLLERFARNRQAAASRPRLLG